MATRHLSLRIRTDTFEGLTRRSRQTGQPVSQLINTLLEEGLRMEHHPGIVFRPGPAGRRPGLAAGPDVWEVVQVLRDLGGRGEDAVQRTAERMRLTPEQIETAVGYYAEYQDEIDAWIARNERAAEEAEAAWLRRQAVLGA